MIIMKLRNIYIASLIAISAACSKEAPEQYAPADVAPLHAIMPGYAELDSASRAEIADSLKPELTAFFKAVAEGYTLSDTLIQAWSHSRQVNTFTPPADSVFPSIEPIRESLGYTLGAAGTRGLQLPARRYATVVYGRNEAILFVDSVMLIALNHFLGPEYEGYSRWPVYRRLEKDPAKLPYYMAEALIANEYPYTAEGEDATLLSHLLYQGALTYAKMQVVKNADRALALDYSDEDLAWIDANSAKLWSELASSNLIYDTSETLAARFVMPSPSVRDLPTVYPGRIGRYVGLRLVEEYVRKHPEATLAELLSPSFYTSPEFVQTNAAETFR